MGGTELRPKLKGKRWSADRESELLELWEREGIYKFDPKAKGEVVAIDTPPPYASGKWHVGGAAHYAQIDMVARYFRMKGYNVLVPFYADRNGLPVEVQVEKATGVNPHEITKSPEGRRKFLELCKDFLDRTESEIVKVWRRLGCSFEYWRDGTDSPEYRRLTQATFIELWRRGLIYLAERPVNWCPRCRTTLADAELEYKEEKAKLYYVKFKVKETGEDVTIATTRPELLNACAAVIYNPSDKRYRELEGKHAIIPLYEREVPIRPHPEARPEFGTGLMMVCSYGDTADIKLFRELKLTPRVIIDKEGKLTKEAGPLAGLSIREARERIAEVLRSKGCLVKVEELTHKVPVCWRCKTPVEFIHTEEYFLKQTAFLDDLRKVIDQIQFKPEFHKRKLLDWISSITQDWPISRDRYYATEVPVWRCSRCGALLVPEPGRYYRPWVDEPPFERCSECGAPKEELVGETKVFDTWFDSSVSVLYVTGFGRDQELYERAIRNSIRPQGYDIIRTWLYYSILRVYQLTGRPAFRWVRITGMGLDEKGEAMHKSKGNIIDPEPVISKYGADAFRYWAAASAKLGYDYRYSEQMVRTGALFATKLWNIARFVSTFPEPEASEVALRSIDKAMLGYANDVINKVDEAYSNLDTYEPANATYRLAWNVFASHYLEMVKDRAYNRGSKYPEEEQKAAWYTLHKVLKMVLRLLAPIMPFVTDAIWREMYGGSVHRQRFPEPDPHGSGDLASRFERLMSANSAVWSYKKRRNMRLSEPLDALVLLPEELGPFAEDFKEFHKIREVRISPEVSEVKIVTR